MAAIDLRASTMQILECFDKTDTVALEESVGRSKLHL